MITAFASIAFGQQREQDFHLGAIVLDVADVIECQALEAVQALEFPGEAQVAFGIEEALHQTGDRGEQHRIAAFDQRACQRRHDVRLAGPWSADQAHVGGAGDELPAQQLLYLTAQRCGITGKIQRRGALLAR